MKKAKIGESVCWIHRNYTPEPPVFTIATGRIENNRGQYLAVWRDGEAERTWVSRHELYRITRDNVAFLKAELDYEIQSMFVQQEQRRASQAIYDAYKGNLDALRAKMELARQKVPADG